MEHRATAAWVFGIRDSLRLTQAEFAERYGISPATVRKWEQGIRAPQGAARTLLAVIEQEPEAVTRALLR